MTEEEFLAEPTRRQWEFELRLGWSGPDGSTASTDHICGVRIGKKDPDYVYHNLPANRHDWQYRLARRTRLPKEFRILADEMYRDGCIWRVESADIGWTLTKIAAARSWIRYYTLRAAARFAWTAKAKERNECWEHCSV